jgi:hypothetical protein
MFRGLVLSWGILAASALAQSPAANLGASQGTPVPATIMPESLRSFNPLALAVTWNDGRWQIVHGSDVLKDFGSSERDARQAFRIIQELGVNQHGTIGSLQPAMEYWLINGRAPQNMPRDGLLVQPLEPSRLQVQQTFTQWTLRDGMRTLFSFGEREDNARLALEVIRKYGFTQLGTMGIGAPKMYVFFGRATATVMGAPDVSATTLHTARMTPPHFSRIAKNSDGTPHVEKAVANGLEGLAPAVVPPLRTPEAPRSTVPGPAAAWHDPPHLGPFQPAAPVTAEGRDRMVFDWRRVEVRVDGAEWKLTLGRQVLGSFGTDALAARLALSAMRYYRFRELRHAGNDASGPEYYLASPQAPKGVLIGLYAEPFQPEHVEVRMLEGRYIVVDGIHPLMDFGARKAEAEQLVAQIRQQKYNRLCRVSPFNTTGMMFLVRAE